MDARPLSLFSLPRELRNEIYHHIFTADPYLRTTISDGCNVYTHYGRRCCKREPPDSSIASPTWLLTCRVLMSEALEHYSRHASWIYESGWYTPHRRSEKLPLDQTKFRTMEVDVQFMLDWTISCLTPSEDPRSLVWPLVEHLKEAEVSPEIVRFHGYTRSIEESGTAENPLDWYVQAFKEMRDHFEELEVRKWFLEVASMDKTWKIELVFEFSDGEMVLVQEESGEEREHTQSCNRIFEDAVQPKNYRLTKKILQEESDVVQTIHRRRNRWFHRYFHIRN